MSLCKRSNCSEFSNEFVHLCLVHYLGTLNTEYNPLLCLVQLSAAGLGSTESHRMQPNGTLVPIVSAASTSVPSVLPPMPTRSLPCLPSLQGKYDRQCPLLQVKLLTREALLSNCFLASVYSSMSNLHSPHRQGQVIDKSK